MSSKRVLSPVHPGEILQEDFLDEMGISQNKLALALRVPARRINEIVLGKRGVTADTAMRLARFFKVSPEFWLNLQTRYDLETAKDELEEQILKDVQTMDELVH